MALIAGQVPMTGYQPPNYAGIAEAAALPVTQMAGMVQQVGDYFKQQSEKKKAIKASATQIDAALKLMPELSPILSDVANRIKDENIPIDDRVADASIVGDLIKNSMSGLMSQQMMSLRQQKFAASQGGGGGEKASGGGGESAPSQITF